MKTVTDVLNKGLDITWEEIRIAKNLIRSRGCKDKLTRAQCQIAFTYISFLYKLGLISLREQISMVENITNEMRLKNV